MRRPADRNILAQRRQGAEERISETFGILPRYTGVLLEMCEYLGPTTFYGRLGGEKNSKLTQSATNALRRLGWRVLSVWECQLRKPERLSRRLAKLRAKSPLSPAKPG
jgi:hypothetical protein